MFEAESFVLAPTTVLKLTWSTVRKDHTVVEITTVKEKFHLKINDQGDEHTEALIDIMQVPNAVITYRCVEGQLWIIPVAHIVDIEIYGVRVEPE